MKVLSSCHSSQASSPLPGFIICFLTCSVHRMGSAKFTVIGPPDPVAAILGQEAVFPCHLSPRMSAANMEVRWFRPEFVSFVHLYHDGKDQYEGQMPEYEGRTELLKAGLTDGNVPLRILNIRPSDEGQYHCFVQDGTFYEETVLELRVAGLGSAPLISVEGHQDGGIRVVCRSAGWYPEPEVLWKDFNGQRLPSLSETKSRGDNNLFETETALIVTEHSNQNLSCCIRNTVLNQDKESAVYIADLFFPRVNPLMATLSVILVVLFAFIGLTVYLFKMKAKLTEEVVKRDLEIALSPIEACSAGLDVRGYLGPVLSFHHVRRNVGSTLGERHSCNLMEVLMLYILVYVWKNFLFPSVISLYNIESCNTCSDPLSSLIMWLVLGWRRSVAPIEEVNVTLDPDTAQSQLVLSEDGKSVRWGDTRQDLPDNPERFDSRACVLGCEGFTAETHCWEVEVGDGELWAVGVARESVRRKGWISLSPEQGIWAVGQCGGQFRALTSPEAPLPLSQVPSRIRVCLDCDRWQVTFSDADDGAPIFTFPPGSIPGERIRPWFWLGVGGSRLSLCP
ncbi:butyrophilin subfamily 1 member A1-like [Eretmochelys imbricata]